MSPIALEKEDHDRDAAFSKALHSEDAKEKTGLLAMMNKNAKAQKVAVDEYFKHWDNKGAADETVDTREVGLPIFVFLAFCYLNSLNI